MKKQHDLKLLLLYFSLQSPIESHMMMEKNFSFSFLCNTQKACCCHCCCSTNKQTEKKWQYLTSEQTINKTKKKNRIKSFTFHKINWLYSISGTILSTLNRDKEIGHNPKRLIFVYIRKNKKLLLPNNNRNNHKMMMTKINHHSLYITFLDSYDVSICRLFDIYTMMKYQN